MIGVEISTPLADNESFITIEHSASHNPPTIAGLLQSE